MKRFAMTALTVGVFTIALTASAQQTPPAGSTTTPGDQKCPNVAPGPTSGSRSTTMPCTGSTASGSTMGSGSGSGSTSMPGTGSTASGSTMGSGSGSGTAPVPPATSGSGSTAGGSATPGTSTGAGSGTTTTC